MYVCICKGISEKKLQESAGQGQKGLKDLKSALGLGSQCGKCLHAAHDLLKQQGQITHPGREH